MGRAPGERRRRDPATRGGLSHVPESTCGGRAGGGNPAAGAGGGGGAFRVGGRGTRRRPRRRRPGDLLSRLLFILSRLLFSGSPSLLSRLLPALLLRRRHQPVHLQSADLLAGLPSPRADGHVLVRPG